MNLRRNMLIRSLVLLVILFSSCTPQTTESTFPNKAYGKHPLVLSIVLDQVGSWALERYLPYLDEHGLIRSHLPKAEYFKYVQLAHATTFTAPGHAAIFTGEPPRHSGIGANRVWDYKRNDVRMIVDTGKHRVFADTAHFASPDELEAQTVGDLLKVQSRGKSKVVSISIKPWPAVVSGGKKADLAAWYTPRENDGAMSTSSYYSKEEPSWISSWNKDHTVAQFWGAWDAENQKLYTSVVGADEGPGEDTLEGWSTTFPHDPKKAKEPYVAFEYTPQATAYLLKFTEKAVEHYGLGQDSYPDLLMVSVSGTDKIGHTFGVESWEYLDNLIRVDRMLGQFVAQLEKTTDLSVLITSDHGSYPLPEKSEHPEEGGRLDYEATLNDLNTLAQKQLGQGKWFAYLEFPLLYFAQEAKTGDKRKKLIAIATEYFTKLSGVSRVFDTAEFSSESEEKDPLREAIRLSLPAKLGADMYIIPGQNTVPRAKGGTTHGSPWPHDRQVPVIVWRSRAHADAAQTPQGSQEMIRNELYDQRRIASTLADLLGLPALKRPSLLETSK
ncbi:MAG: alkaline phosphatase family protein [Myxococcales bacterium]|nr:MAG: alkaline phosphatase family protein [Myxococcales bacterium]